MLVAFETTWDADNNRIGRAVVCDTGSLQIGIVCARIGDGPSDWEPLYIMTRDDQQRPLPSCFALNEEALAALNLMTIRDRTP
jgi:hypothetical protein